MKRTAAMLIALIAAITIFFTGCSKDDDNNLMNDNKTSTSTPATTSKPTTDNAITSNRDENAGAPESTSKDSALGDAVEDAADGVGDIADGIDGAADRARNDINNKTTNDNRYSH